MAKGLGDLTQEGMTAVWRAIIGAVLVGTVGASWTTYERAFAAEKAAQATNRELLDIRREQASQTLILSSLRDSSTTLQVTMNEGIKQVVGDLSRRIQRLEQESDRLRESVSTLQERLAATQPRPAPSGR